MVAIDFTPQEEKKMVLLLKESEYVLTWNYKNMKCVSPKVNNVITKRPSTQWLEWVACKEAYGLINGFSGYNQIIMVTKYQQ